MALDEAVAQPPVEIAVGHREGDKSTLLQRKVIMRAAQALHDAIERDELDHHSTFACCFLSGPEQFWHEPVLALGLALGLGASGVPSAAGSMAVSRRSRNLHRFGSRDDHPRVDC